MTHSEVVKQKNESKSTKQLVRGGRGETTVGFLLYCAPRRSTGAFSVCFRKNKKAIKGMLPSIASKV